MSCTTYYSGEKGKPNYQPIDCTDGAKNGCLYHLKNWMKIYWMSCSTRSGDEMKNPHYQPIDCTDGAKNGCLYQ